MMDEKENTEYGNKYCSVLKTARYSGQSLCAKASASQYSSLTMSLF